MLDHNHVHIMEAFEEKDSFHLCKEVYNVLGHSKFRNFSAFQESKDIIELFIQNNQTECIATVVNESDVNLYFSSTNKNYLLTYNNDHYLLDDKILSLSLVKDIFLHHRKGNQLFKRQNFAFLFKNYLFNINLMVDKKTKTVSSKIDMVASFPNSAYLQIFFFNHFMIFIDSLIKNNTFNSLSDGNKNAIRLIMCYYTGTHIDELTQETLLSHRNLMEMLHE